MPTISDSVWAIVDPDIFEKRIINGIYKLKVELEINLPEALEIFNGRYLELRQTRPSEFTIPENEYWRNFYS